MKTLIDTMAFTILLLTIVLYLMSFVILTYDITIEYGKRTQSPDVNFISITTNW